MQPMFRLGRYGQRGGGPCVAAIAGKHLFLVDVGPVTLGQDGTEISLPAGSDRIDLR